MAQVVPGLSYSSAAARGGGGGFAAGEVRTASPEDWGRHSPFRWFGLLWRFLNGTVAGFLMHTNGARDFTGMIPVGFSELWLMRVCKARRNRDKESSGVIQQLRRVKRRSEIRDLLHSVRVGSEKKKEAIYMHLHKA